MLKKLFSLMLMMVLSFIFIPQSKARDGTVLFYQPVNTVNFHSVSATAQFTPNRITGNSALNLFNDDPENGGSVTLDKIINFAGDKSTLKRKHKIEKANRIRADTEN